MSVERYQDIMDLPYPQHDPADQDRKRILLPHHAQHQLRHGIMKRFWLYLSTLLALVAVGTFTGHDTTALSALAGILTVTYFVPDKKKTGGAYVTVQGTLKRIDALQRELVLLAENGVSDGRRVPIDEIWYFGGALAQALEDCF